MATKKIEAVGEEEQPKSKKKLIILIVLLLFILGGAGGGWYWWSAKQAQQQEEMADEEDGAPVQKKKKKKKNKDKEDAGPVFVAFEPFTVNLQGEEGLLLQTAITLHMVDEEDANKLKQHMPLIRSRLLMLLSSKKPEEILTTEGKAQLAKEIADQVRQPFFQGDYPLEIQNVLFTSFIVQ